MAKIANVALTNTFNTWRTNSNIAFDRLSQFAINNSSLYANTITANVAFTSTGLATLSGRATVGTNLTVSGNTTLGAAGKTITTTGLLGHTGRATVSTNLTVSGNTTLGAAGKTITSTGILAHTGNLTVSGNTSTNKATVTSLLTVSGNTTIGRTTGGPFFGAHNGTVGATTANTGSFSTIGASGLVTLSGRATVGTNLTVSGNTSTNKATVTSLFTSSGNTNINSSGANGVFANTSGIGFFSNNVNFSSKKVRNFTEDAMSYRASSTAITLSSQRNVQRVSLTGNATVTLPTGMPGGTEAIKTIVVIFKQDATGSRTMAFAAPATETLLYNNSATLPAVSSGATKVTIYVCTKFDGDARWYISQSFIEA
jgi:hypothetical protein